MRRVSWLMVDGDAQLATLNSARMTFARTTRPTIFFIGVTTARSSINAVFPRWASLLGLGDCELRGLDFRLHDQPARYRAAVDFIKHDPLARGALVTTPQDRFVRRVPRPVRRARPALGIDGRTEQPLQTRWRPSRPLG